MDDMISRQKAIDALGEKPLAWEQGEYEEGLQTQWESDVEAIKALPSVGKCFVAEDILKWLLLYHAQAIKLMGRYRPSEVITWVINDMTKTLFNEGEQDG